MTHPTIKTSHTPGPWSYDPSGGAIFYADGDVEPLIASTNLESVSEEQGDADGRLIAASPDLYAALVAAKQEMWVSARLQWTMADFKNWAIIQQIDAALEKADGKQRVPA